ncbi:asparagine synthase-related protein [Streptomyces sp. SM12]|uniref:asparagine synthase-related protein n=1 Tax=Streptomyces sp. SM12 TaxID=1071602 RepID=UPI0011B09D04|nr:asparagine synthase-related protein [Streptomyces sp. SM12]
MRGIADGNEGLVVAGACSPDADLRAGLEAVRAGRWRELTRWAGSYLVVARRAGVVVVIGDLADQVPVFWRLADGGVWWATSARPLAALGTGEIDVATLAAQLVVGEPDLSGAERSLFRDVRRVPAGHLLRLEAGAARVERYEPEPRPVPMAEGAADVARALRAAVGVRCSPGRPVVSDLAGLDSTALACMAAERGEPVIALTHADRRMRDDDLVYARRTAAAVPQLVHQVVEGAAGTVMYGHLTDGLSRVPSTDRPSLYTGTLAIKRRLLGAVPVAGGGVYFTGEGGDVVLSASTGYLLDLYRAGHLLAAWRHTLVHARVRRMRPLVLWRQVVSRAAGGAAGGAERVSAALRLRAGAVLDGTPEATAREVLSPIARWMSRDIARLAADRVTEEAGGLTAESMAWWSDRQDLCRIGASMESWRALCAADGLELAAPYLENEVIRACLRVAAAERGRADRYKPLLRAAFPAGPVPAHVLGRSTKGGLDQLANEGLRMHSRDIAKLLGPGSQLAALGLLPASGLPLAEVEGAAVSRPGCSQGAVHHAVATEVWLRQVQAPGTTWWSLPRKQQWQDGGAGHAGS